MKLKETLNLGKTALPMRAGLPNKEPIWQKRVGEEVKMIIVVRVGTKANPTSLFLMVLLMPMVIFTLVSDE